MVELGLAGFLVGCLLGQRFAVLVLLPVQLSGLAAAVAAAWWQAGWPAAILGFLTFSIASQAGYAFALARFLKPRLRAA